MSTGSSFSPSEVWLTSPGRPSALHFADVDGDGAADAIHLDREQLRVFVSDHARFAPATRGWLTKPPVGARANYFADVTGDGRADAVTLENLRILVSPSTGEDFASPHIWLDQAYYGGF